MLFTPADHINCIHMPIVGFLCYPEGQFKQQLCNIGFGRRSRLKGESHYMGFVERASELSCVHSERATNQNPRPACFGVESENSVSICVRGVHRGKKELFKTKLLCFRQSN